MSARKRRKSESRKLPPLSGGEEQVLDGEPARIPLLRFAGDGALRGAMWLTCCECGFRHLISYAVYGEGEATYLVVRHYADDDSRRKK